MCVAVCLRVCAQKTGSDSDWVFAEIAVQSVALQQCYFSPLGMNGGMLNSAPELIFYVLHYYPVCKYALHCTRNRSAICSSVSTTERAKASANSGCGTGWCQAGRQLTAIVVRWW